MARTPSLGCCWVRVVFPAVAFGEADINRVNSPDFRILVFRSEFSRIQPLLRDERNQAEVPLHGLKRLSHVLQSDRSTVVEALAQRVDPAAQRLFDGQRDLLDPQQLVTDRCRPAVGNAIPARDPNLAQERNLAARIVDTIAKTENKV